NGTIHPAQLVGVSSGLIGFSQPWNSTTYAHNGTAGIELTGCSHIEIDGLERGNLTIIGHPVFGVHADGATDITLRILNVQWCGGSGIIFRIKSSLLLNNTGIVIDN